MDRSRVAVVIPALNESATIAKVVNAASAYGVPIVISDGSTDRTAELAEKAGAVVVSHEYNLGYDAALNSGFRKAASLNFDIVVTLDADGQHDPFLLKQFVALFLDKDVDVVIGVRNRRQRLAEHLFAWYSNLRYGIRDPLCGMKAYRISVYRKLGHFDSYGSIGTELILFAARNNYKIEQLPLVVREREGVPRFGRVIAGNYKIFRALLMSLWTTRSY